MRISLYVLGTLAATILGNALAIKGVIRPGKKFIRVGQHF